MNLGLSLALTRRGGLSAEAAVRALFAGGTGYMYDLQQAGTRWQDSGGTTPATSAAQPVGLLADVSNALALGPELWADQTPTISNFNGTSGTYNSATNTMGNAVAGGTSTWPRWGFNLGLVSGAYYYVDIQLSSASSLAAWQVYGDNGRPLSQTGGRFRGYVIGPSSGGLLTIQSALGTSSGWTVTIDSITVKAFPGRHAHQSTAGARPTLRQTGGGVWYLEDDGGDSINATLTAGTYTRKTVNSTGTITTETGLALTGATDVLTVNNMAGAFAINRALSGAEDTLVDSWLTALT